MIESLALGGGYFDAWSSHGGKRRKKKNRKSK
jgi:hypothetical protein